MKEVDIMAEKDTISKTLESYPDVFADIINGFLFFDGLLFSDCFFCFAAVFFCEFLAF